MYVFALKTSSPGVWEAPYKREAWCDCGGNLEQGSCPSECRVGKTRLPPCLGWIALMSNKQPPIQGGGLDEYTHPLI